MPDILVLSSKEELRKNLSHEIQTLKRSSRRDFKS
jgi:hypothetical protein